MATSTQPAPRSRLGEWLDERLGLKGISYAVPFTAAFTIPAETAPGSYTVRAVTKEGETATADLTLTAPSEQASAAPAMAQEPSGELHAIDRAKPIGQIMAVAAVIALSVAAGFVLIHNRG